MRCITLTRVTSLCTREAKFRNALRLRFPVFRWLCIAAFLGFAWRLPDGSGYLSDFRMVIFRRFPHGDLPLPVWLYRGFCRFSYCDIPVFLRVVVLLFPAENGAFREDGTFCGRLPVFLLLKGLVRLFFSSFCGRLPVFLLLKGWGAPVFSSFCGRLPVFLLLQIGMFLFFLFLRGQFRCARFSFFRTRFASFFLFRVCAGKGALFLRFHQRKRAENARKSAARSPEKTFAVR